MPTDNKKAWSLIKRLQNILASDQLNNNEMQSIKSDYQAASPDTEAQGFPLTSQEVTDITDLISSHNDFMTTHGATISMVLSFDAGSHKGNAL